jgi:EAL domain-containing protein (putative c-di-GMP-specific phosphodiesterase class I)
MSVNVSARQFKEGNLAERVARALNETGLEARYLELEVTESLIMHDQEQAVSTMQQLQRMGVHLSIDDFGTGYSSLSTLKSYPISRLKIDRSLIGDLAIDEDDQAITKAVISLGHQLGLHVVAEGVESQPQADFLRSNGCDAMQGYLFSRPVPPEGVETMLAEQARSLHDRQYAATVVGHPDH